VPHYRPVHVNQPYTLTPLGTPTGGDQLVWAGNGPGYIAYLQVQSVSGQVGIGLINKDLTGPALVMPPSNVSVTTSSISPALGGQAATYIFPSLEVINAARPDLTQSGNVVTTQAATLLPIDTVLSFFNTVESAVFTISHITAGSILMASMTFAGMFIFSGNLEIHIASFFPSNTVASVRAVIYQETQYP
jgi:hypothetical protein